MPSRRFALVALALPLLVLASCGRDGPTELGSPAPAVRMAGQPSPVITFGPAQNGVWGPDVRFEWIESPPAAGREWTLLHTDEYLADTGAGSIVTLEVIAWMDSLQFHPGTPDPAWVVTPDNFVNLEDLELTEPDQRWIFGVRSYDADGVRATLQVPDNVRFFRVSDSVSGPHITLHTSYGDCVHSGVPDAEPTSIFRTGIRFDWEARPGAAGIPPAQTFWAVGEPANWTPAGESGGTWPAEGEDPWLPDEGPTSFHVRAVNQAGFEEILSYELDVWTFTGRGVLAVLDTQPGALQDLSIWPDDYETVERELVKVWLQGRPLTLWETLGTEPPAADRMAGASTILWLHSTSVADGDNSVLHTMFSQDRATRSLLTSWHQAGGNLILAGINPVNALRYFMDTTCNANYIQNDPVVFRQTLEDPTLMPHFAATELSVDQVTKVWRNPFAVPQEGRLGIARSALPGLPDVEFDPTRMPNGPLLRGFGYWDEGIVPRGDAVVAYTSNDTASSVATLLLNGPGRQGNALYLGFHPYFLDELQTVEMFDAVLDAFGELGVETGKWPD